jgi:hypothetical protein
MQFIDDLCSTDTGSSGNYSSAGRSKRAVHLEMEKLPARLVQASFNSAESAKSRLKHVVESVII